MAYTWDNAMQEGRRRLALLERSLDPGTFRRLESIGVREGWRCVGAGGGTVCDWLARRVGAAGRVCAIDVDARFLQALDDPRFEIREEDILDSDLPDAAFDLVHTLDADARPGARPRAVQADRAAQAGRHALPRGAGCQSNRDARSNGLARRVAAGGSDHRAPRRRAATSPARTASWRNSTIRRNSSSGQ